ncbi:hypothetical protein P5E48_04545 [Clostridium perfringens]|jgi:hypothetical protein|uniref:hypothetical protein n=1 Tax=Clostridium perfringens TaxID=1502 RepID=UPI001CCEDCCA|nr:hypothetical protein [Clostridium perfringens]EJT5918997.1 hypothetical protein [Clostridium perfringens]MDK0533937.1 hypothetical protein [Clostridium perfringens]MDK0792509.1 hypothetical protein [Clostridium perfringens]MDK0903551.1 hypothetical protein [Clostridium perfringens]MDK0909393.1 hypothetical protein [Clostridium perfringens]
MSLKDEFLDNIKKVKVVKREISIPVKYRSLYRLAQILLVMNINGRSNTCSLKKINIIISALDDKEQEVDLHNFLENKLSNPLVVRYDPAINRALSLAYAEQIISVNNTGNFMITDKGKVLVDEIYTKKEIFNEDISVLKRIGKKLTETLITESLN